jgi:hypothetical protein
LQSVLEKLLIVLNVKRRGADAMMTDADSNRGVMLSLSKHGRKGQMTARQSQRSALGRQGFEALRVRHPFFELLFDSTACFLPGCKADIVYIKLMAKCFTFM